MVRSTTIEGRSVPVTGRSVAPSAASTAWIDTFDDQSLAPYTGDTANFGFDTTTVYQGAASLTSTSGANTAMASASGLDNYPSVGDTFGIYLKSTVGDGDAAQGEARVHWGGSGDLSNSYFLRFRPSISYIVIRKNTASSGSTLTSSTFTPTTTGAWYYAECAYLPSGSTWTIYDATDLGTPLGTVSTTDTDWTGTTVGVGGTVDAGEQIWFDAWHLV